MIQKKLAKRKEDLRLKEDFRIGEDLPAAEGNLTQPGGGGSRIRERRAKLKKQKEEFFRAERKGGHVLRLEHRNGSHVFWFRQKKAMFSDPAEMLDFGSFSS